MFIYKFILRILLLTSLTGIATFSIMSNKIQEIHGGSLVDATKIFIFILMGLLILVTIAINKDMTIDSNKKPVFFALTFIGNIVFMTYYLFIYGNKPNKVKMLELDSALIISFILLLLYNLSLGYFKIFLNSFALPISIFAGILFVWFLYTVLVEKRLSKESKWIWIVISVIIPIIIPVVFFEFTYKYLPISTANK